MVIHVIVQQSLDFWREYTHEASPNEWHEDPGIGGTDTLELLHAALDVDSWCDWYHFSKLHARNVNVLVFA